MTHTKSALAASIVACTASFSFGWSEQGGISLSVESAQARVGRPLTPVSVAGVARRQARRAVYGAEFAGAVAVVQRPQIGRLGTCSALAYAYSYVFFTGTVVYALVNDTKDYATLNGFVCHPGSLTKLDNGRYYRCQ